MQLKIRQFIEKKFLFQMTIGNLIIGIYINSTNQRAKIFELSENNL